MRQEARAETGSVAEPRGSLGRIDGVGVDELALTFHVVHQPATKRVMDVILATVGLILSAPLWVLISFAIKLEDGGPVLFSQERWGRAGMRFRLHKFRTMVESDETLGVRQALEGDERVTRVGRALRASGMDELPQLFNILIGDMSMVGPRALAFAEVVSNPEGELVTYESVPGFTERLSVRPGLTGLATVYMHKDAQPLTKFRCDVRYIEEQSLWLDARLVLISLWISLRGKWEQRGPKL
jgi:polysaccharide biosynthesis protein PslA